MELEKKEANPHPRKLASQSDCRTNETKGAYKTIPSIVKRKTYRFSSIPGWSNDDRLERPFALASGARHESASHFRENRISNQEINKGGYAGCKVKLTRQKKKPPQAGEATSRGLELI